MTTGQHADLQHIFTVINEIKEAKTYLLTTTVTVNKCSNCTVSK